MTVHIAARRLDPVATATKHQSLPGWRWAAVVLAFPIAGYLGWAISGPVNALGAAQGLALARQGPRRLAAAWAITMPLLLALGWCVSAGIGISIEDQFTLFGAAGAVLFTLLSGVLLARLTREDDQEEKAAS
jgi:hypothetical protein